MREPAASRPDRRRKPKARQAARVLCAGADTARQRARAMGSGMALAPKGAGPWPQPGADGHAGRLKPWPASSPWAVAGNLFQRYRVNRQSRIARLRCKNGVRPLAMAEEDYQDARESSRNRPQEL
jgi:hypothetical protein